MRANTSSWRSGPSTPAPPSCARKRLLSFRNSYGRRSSQGGEKSSASNRGAMHFAVEEQRRSRLIVRGALWRVDRPMLLGFPNHVGSGGCGAPLRGRHCATVPHTQRQGRVLARVRVLLHHRMGHQGNNGQLDAWEWFSTDTIILFNDSPSDTLGTNGNEIGILNDFLVCSYQH